MKYFILLFLAGFLSLNGFAQRQGSTRFSIGPELGVAITNPKKVIPGNQGWGVGIGAGIDVQHFFQQNFGTLLYAGIVSYTGRSTGSDSKNKAYTAIPVRVGANYFIRNLHIGAQLGVGFNKLGDVDATAFSYSPQIGYNFKSRNNKPLDLTLKIDGYAGNINFAAANLRLSLIL